MILSGTNMSTIGDLFPGADGSASASSFDRHARMANGDILFAARVSSTLTAMFRSDGTAVGTVKFWPADGVVVATASAVDGPITLSALSGPRALFDAFIDGSATNVTMQTDGTAAGTNLLLDRTHLTNLRFVHAQTSAGALIVVPNGVLLTNGDPEGNQYIQNSAPIQSSSDAYSTESYGNRVTTIATQDEDTEKFVVGTRPGPVRTLQSILSGTAIVDFYSQQVSSSRSLQMVMTPAWGVEPWLVDFDALTIEPLGDLNLGPSSTRFAANSAHSTGGGFLTCITQNNQSRRILLNNGSDSTVVHAGCPGLSQGNDAFLGSSYVFSCETESFGAEPWVYDLSTQSGTLLDDLASGSDSAHPQILGVAQSQIWMLTKNPAALWRSSGVPQQSVLALAFDPAIFAPTAPPSALLADAGAFGIILASNIAGPQYDDGSSAVYRVNASGAQLLQSVPRRGDMSMAVFANKIYFPFHSSEEGLELWESDGTVAGTHMVNLPLRAGVASSRPSNLVAAAGFGVVFQADLGRHEGREWVLWDGSAYSPIVAIEGAESGAFSDQDTATVAGSRLVFTAPHANAGKELHVVDLGRDALFEWGME